MFCGSQISEICGPRCWESSSFLTRRQKGRQLFLEKKCTLAASVPPPNVKSWLRAYVTVYRYSVSCYSCVRQLLLQKKEFYDDDNDDEIRTKYSVYIPNMFDTLLNNKECAELSNQQPQIPIMEFRGVAA